MKKKISYYLLFAAAAYLILRATIFGWMIWSPEFTPGPRADGTPESLRAHVDNLAGEIDDRNFFGTALPKLKEAELYIKVEFEKCGYRTRRQPYKGFDVETANVEALAPDADPRAPYYVVGAHYDTAENPGADDNASAGAVMLELACRLAKDPAAWNPRCGPCPPPNKNAAVLPPCLPPRRQAHGRQGRTIPMGSLASEIY